MKYIFTFGIAFLIGINVASGQCDAIVDFYYSLSSYVQDNDTPEDCSDNFSSLTFSDNSSGISGDYEMLLDNEQVFVGVFGDGGGTLPIPADSVGHSLTMRSLDDDACLVVYDLPIVYTNCPFDPVTFFFNDTNACGTENICVAVQASNFNNILGLQTSVSYDPELLTFTGSTNFNPVMVGFTAASIGNPSPGNLTLTWNDPFAQGVSVPEEEALLELCFTPVVATSYLTSLSYRNSPTPTEVISGGVQEDLPFILNTGSVSCPCELTFSQELLPFDDNGTPTECSDDEFSLLITVNNSQDPTGIWFAEDENGTLLFTGTYGVATEIGPFSLFSNTLELSPIALTIYDANDSNCFLAYSYEPPLPLNCNCEAALDFSPGLVNDNGTPLDCTDDFYVIAFTANFINPIGGTYKVFIDGSLAYQWVIGDEVGYVDAPADGGEHVIMVRDLSVSCSESYLLPAVDSACEGELCELSIDWMTTVYDNGTPTTCIDDFFTIQVIVTGTNEGTEGWSLQDNLGNTYSGNYGSITDLGPYSGMTPAQINLAFDDVENSNCQSTIAVNNPLADCIATPNTLTLSLGDVNACTSEPLCTPFVVDGFDDILGFQFSVNYDPAALLFMGSNDHNPALIGFTSASFSNPNPGNITVNWNDPFWEGADLSAGDTLAVLCFSRIGSNVSPASVIVSGAPTSIEFVNGDLMPVEVVTNAAVIQCTCPIAIATPFVSNNDNGTPNQCSDDEFSFSLVVENPDAVGAIWQALDENGTVVFSGNYGVETLAGPFPLYDETLAKNTIQWTIQDVMEPLCNYIYTYIPPEPVNCDCEMYVDITPGSLPNWIDCSSGGSSFDFSVTVNKIPDNAGPERYQLYQDEEVITDYLPYGSRTLSLDINTKPVVLRFEDLTDPSCFTEVDFQPLAQDCRTDLSLQISETPNTEPQAGEIFDLHLRLANNDLRTATGIAVAAPVPVGYTYLGSNGNYNPVTGEWQVDQLICEEDTTLTLSLRMEANGDSLFLAEVVAVNEEDSDSTPANGVDTDADGYFADDPDDEDDGDAWLPCPVQVGTLTLFADTLCTEEPLDWILNSDADLPIGYIRGVALYADVNALPGDYLAFTTSNTLTPLGGIEPNRPYYLRLLAGPDDGNGGIDLMDNCLRRGKIDTVFWSEIIIENCEPVVLNCANPVGLLSCTASGGIGILTYTWSQNGVVFANTPQAIASGVGNFLLEVQDEIGCVTSQEIIVVGDFSAPVLSLSRTGSLCDEDGVFITVTSDMEGMDYSWSTGESGSQISVFSGGTYTVMATNAENGCTGESTIIINDILDECNILEGTVYRSENCLASETPLVGWLVEVTGENYLQYQYTNSQGNYQIAVPQGTYQVRLVANSPTWGACEENGQTIVFSGYGETLSQVLLAQPLDNCPLLEVSIDVGILRPCLADRALTLAYGNVGTDTLFNGLLTVVLPPELTFNGTTGTYQGSVGDTLFFTPILPLAPGANQQFTVFVEVACDTIVGRSLCVQALGLPYGPCPQASEVWSGGSLQVSGECNAEEVVFTLRNVGDATLSSGGSYIVIQDGVMLWEVPEDIPPLNPDETTTVSFPANGNTFLLEAEQEPFHPGFSNPSVVLEGCGTNEDGIYSVGYVTQFPNDDEDVFVDEDCRVVTASYDPNDKQAEPLGYATEHYVLPERSLEYTIRFQNTGTDTAFTVVIRDTLSPWLDMRTLRPGVSSHLYELELDTARTLSFVFNDILLPDSTTNLDGSQGFVSYRVKPLLTAPLETRIENTAAIYFDFNDPIITNTVYHTLGRNFVDLINWTTVPSAATTWRLFPNPNEGHLNVEWSPATERAILVVTDAWGRQQAQFTLTGGKMQLDVHFLPPGWYGLQLLGAKGHLLGTGKLIRK
ncbi:MAG: DUF7619 domain-containing protein [Lewinella sp.]|uniref:DUF7619 domain-containing protein n=1 Tax=Lewinella sp. TaxID=2004506 RepID=UPI003D6BC812